MKPIGFLVVGNGHVRMLPVDGNTVADRIIDIAPQVIDQIQNIFKRQEMPPQAQINYNTTPPAAPVS